MHNNVVFIGGKYLLPSKLSLRIFNAQYLRKTYKNYTLKMNNTSNNKKNVHLVESTLIITIIVL